MNSTVDKGEIQLQQSGPHVLEVKFRPITGSAGNWASEANTLIITYGQLGATSGRADIGVNGDIAVGWGDAKFESTSPGEFGIYTRGTPFSSGDDMLVQDSRALNDSSNVLIETYTNEVFDKPGVWASGVTWNEGAVLEFEVLSDDKTFFDDFEILQKEPGRFLGASGVPAAIALGDLADWYDGAGSLTFGRVGCDWLGPREVDWLVGPFAAFDLIPPDGAPWPYDTAPLGVEAGSYAIAHTPTPEPSTLILLTVAGLGAVSPRRRPRV